MSLINKVFQYSFIIVLLISFYFFIDVIVFKNKTHSEVFSTWQFPMLLAIYIDIIYKL
jgi:hypothetical protein